MSYSILLVYYLLRRRRLCYDISEGKYENNVEVFELHSLIIENCLFIETWQHFVTVGEVLLGGYLFHFIPFFFYDRTLFVHHYLPAYIYKIMLSSFLISHMYEVLTKKFSILKIVMYISLLIWFVLVLKIFSEFSSLSYGVYPLNSDEVKTLRWKDTWDLIIHKP